MPTVAVLSIVVVGMLLWLINGIIPITGKIKAALNIVFALIIVGVSLWLINTYVPMAGSIKAILNIVVVIATCVGVLQAVGLWEPLVAMLTNFRRNHKAGPVVPPETPHPSTPPTA